MRSEFISKVFKLDTDNAGCDELLSGGSRAEVMQDVLSHHDIAELKAGWTLEEVELTEEVSGQIAPWAAKIVEVEGGFMAFESMSDYETWANQI